MRLPFREARSGHIPLPQDAISEHEIHGSPEVIPRIQLRQQLLAEHRYDEANKIRPIVYFVGGGHRVAWEVGMVKIMYAMEWFRRQFVGEEEEQDAPIIAGVGASGGIFVLANGALGRERSQGILNTNVARKFASVWNIFKAGERGERGFVDFDTFHRETLGRDFALVPEDFTRDVMDIHAVVTNLDTAKQELLKMNGHTNPNEIAAASSTIPLVGNVEFVEIGGKKYIDGDMLGIPVDLLIELFNPTDVLVVLCDTFESIMKKKRTGDLMEWIGERVRHPVGQVVLKSPNALMRSVKQLFSMQWQREDFRAALVGPREAELGSFTMNAQQIDDVVKKSDRGAQELFSRRLSA